MFSSVVSRWGLIFAGVTIAALTHGAFSQETPGRFSMKETDTGILRMDTQTGQVSHCRKAGEEWACETVADDRSGAEDRVTALRKENDELKAKLAEAENARGETKAMPDDEELGRVMAFIEKFMRRFFEFARSMRDSFGTEA